MSKDKAIALDSEYAVKWTPFLNLQIFPYFEDADGEIRKSIYGGSVALSEQAQEALYRLLARQRHDRAAAEDQGMLDREKTQ